MVAYSYCNINVCSVSLLNIFTELNYISSFCILIRLTKSKLCTNAHTGTSASAPLAAGVVALALGTLEHTDGHSGA